MPRGSTRPHGSGRGDHAGDASSGRCPRRVRGHGSALPREASLAEARRQTRHRRSARENRRSELEMRTADVEYLCLHAHARVGGRPLFAEQQRNADCRLKPCGGRGRSHIRWVGTLSRAFKWSPMCVGQARLGPQYYFANGALVRRQGEVFVAREWCTEMSCFKRASARGLSGFVRCCVARSGCETFVALRLLWR